MSKPLLGVGSLGVSVICSSYETLDSIGIGGVVELVFTLPPAYLAWLV